MKGLLAVLGKAAGGAPPSDPAMPPSDMASDDADSGFADSAAQAMDAIKNDDAQGFAEALKACIQMGG